MYCPLYLYLLPLLFSCDRFWTEICFVWDKDGYTHFLSATICMEYHLPALYFKPMFVLKAEMNLGRLNGAGSSLLLHPAPLRLFIGEFIPFTFRVIINIWALPIAQLSFASCLFYISILSLHFCFCLPFWFSDFLWCFLCIPWGFFLCLFHVSALDFWFFAYHEICIKVVIHENFFCS